MAELQDTRRGVAIAAFALAYFLLLVYAIVTGDPLANTLADVFFVVMIVGFGVYVVQKFGTEPLPIVAGVALVASGIAQAAALAINSEIARGVSTILLLVGLGIYLYLGR